jgi:hypothetical protein
MALDVTLHMTWLLQVDTRGATLCKEIHTCDYWLACGHFQSSHATTHIASDLL